MARDTSAYRELGLEPGADAASVEAAYRNLIKRFHPDRAGGDAARAAEINRAYQQIRRAQQLPTLRRTSYPVVQPAYRRGTPWGARAFALALVAGIAALAIASPLDVTTVGLGEMMREPVLVSQQPVPQDPAASEIGQIGEQPLDSDAIDRSVLTAVRMAGSGEVRRLGDQSRRCHAELRRDPALARFDQCVAFDEAAVVLLHRNRMDVEGQFSSASVTGRHLGAARLFSEDYLMIESRLDRIRSRVEFSLAPPDPQPLPVLEL